MGIVRDLEEYRAVIRQQMKAKDMQQQLPTE